MMNVIYLKEKCKSKSAKVMQDLMTNDNSKKSKKNKIHLTVTAIYGKIIKFVEKQERYQHTEEKNCK